MLTLCIVSGEHKSRDTWMREKGGEERSEGGRSQVVHNRDAETSQGSTVACSTIQGGSGEAVDG